MNIIYKVILFMSLLNLFMSCNTSEKINVITQKKGWCFIILTSQGENQFDSATSTYSVSLDTNNVGYLFLQGLKDSSQASFLLNGEKIEDKAVLFSHTSRECFDYVSFYILPEGSDFVKGSEEELNLIDERWKVFERIKHLYKCEK